MNNPQFYIFGVPDGFDMYNATPERVKFFQLMYNGEYCEDRKMIIYRKDDNSEVTYMYLRYNMLSFKGRPSSFLGMALTFSEGYYCTDISRLLNLFDSFYVALSDDVLLTKKGAVGQGRYLVRSFAEKTAVIIKMEEIVESQTRGWFGDCIVPMDETFQKGTYNVSRKSGLFTDTRSEHIIANLKTASWIFLSGREAGENQQPQPPQQQVPQPRQQATQLRPQMPQQQQQQRPPQFQPQPRQQQPLQQQQPPQQQQPQQRLNLQQPSQHQVDAESRRQQEDLREIKKEFDIERNISYYKLNKTNLQKKLKKYEDFERRLYSLSHASSSSDGVDLNNQISSEIKRIYTCINEIERNKRIKKRVFGILGVVVIGIVMFVFFPKSPEPVDDWETTKNELTKQIGVLRDNGIADSLKKYSQYSDDANYISAKVHLDTCKNYLELADRSLKNNDSMYIEIIKMDINIADTHLKDAKENLESLRNKIKNQPQTPGIGGSSSTPSSGGSPSTPRSDGSTPKSGSGGSTASTSSSSGKTKTSNGENTEIKDNQWRLKINGKWAEGFEYKVGTGAHFKIQVYNGNKPVEVIWDWSPNVTVYTKGIQSSITELDNIEVSRRTQGKGKVTFWTKDNPQKKMTIYLLSDD